METPDQCDYVIQRKPTTLKGTFGLWNDKDGNPVCVTVELPWFKNVPSKSCIPEGKYWVTQYDSPTKGDVWQINDVPGRSNIEIHIANEILDIKGCIGVGRMFGMVQGLPAVLDSATTFAHMKQELPSQFWLEIRDSKLSMVQPIDN